MPSSLEQLRCCYGTEAAQQELEQIILQTKIKSRLIIESLGPRSCRQTLAGSIDVQVSGIGRIAERIIVQQLAQVYTSIPAVIDRYTGLF